MVYWGFREFFWYVVFATQDVKQINQWLRELQRK